MFKCLLGFRKLIIMSSVVVIGTTMLILGFVTSADFTSLLTTTSVAFFGTNVSEHMLSWLKKRGVKDE